MKTLLLKPLLFLAALSAALSAQTLEGTWQGTLTPPNQARELRMAFTITQNGSGYQGHFYNLAAGRQLDLGAITLQGTTVKLVIPGNGMTYEGKLESDGSSITGNLVQGTNPLPLLLKRATPETTWELPTPPAPPKTLPEGSKLEFEVATIKPAATPPQGPGFNVTARELRASSISLLDLISFAWDVHPKQVSGLPGWAETDGYSIVGLLPAGGDPTDVQLHTMLRNLVKSRFGVVLHTEKRELSVYVIDFGKNGPAGIKMVKNTTSGARIGGFPGKMTFSGVTMAGFAGVLQQRVLDRPVIDQSGLTDRYDFTLSWTPDEFQFPAIPAARRNAAIEAAAGLPNLFTAFQDQLGLKLDAKKTQAEVYVVDKVSKPSEN